MPREKMEETRILIVDDNSTNLKVLMQVLEAADYSVLVATSGERALHIAAQASPDLILLDVMMPGMDGYEVCRRLKQDVSTQAIPVIFITAFDQTEGVMAGFDAGGVDYIPKPFRQEEVLARVQTHLSLYRLTRELEEKNTALEKKNQQLKEIHEQLEEAQRQLIDDLEEELQTAHDLQMGLMPTESPQISGLHLAGRCLPANHVGGDFFQYFQQEGKLAICMADVTGHAMEAAVPVMMFSGILKTEMQYDNPLEQLFGNLTRLLYETLERRTFVCFAMGELDPSTHALRLSSCGCPYPIHFQAASERVVELQMDAYPLGVRPNTSYQVIEAQLAPGDRMVFYSDGIIEATNTEVEIFGFERMAETIRKGCQENLPAEGLLEQIIGEVKAFAGDTPQADDQTIVVLQVEA